MTYSKSNADDALLDQNLFLVQITVSVPVIAKDPTAALALANQHVQGGSDGLAEIHLVNKRELLWHAKCREVIPHGGDGIQTCAEFYRGWRKEQKRRKAAGLNDGKQLSLFA